jgi:glutathionylspermidine synthase
MSIKAAAHVPTFDGNFPIIGSWYVIDKSAGGMGIRESDTPVTDNLSRFIPHLFLIAQGFMSSFAHQVRKTSYT